MDREKIVAQMTKEAENHRHLADRLTQAAALLSAGEGSGSPKRRSKRKSTKRRTKGEDAN